MPTSGAPPTPVHVVVRPEESWDADAIHLLTDRAFAGQSFSSGTEAAIIRRLRASGELTLSLVAERFDEVVGHVAFSPVSITGSDGQRFGLGPLSVDPGLQRRGIGRRLVGEGLTRLRASGAEGCALIGNPAVYAGYGFVASALRHEGVDPALVQCVAFGGVLPRGTLRFASAFDGP